MRKARDEGGAKGRSEEKIDVARNALKMNMPVDDIIKLTGLSQQQIADIKD